MALELDSPCYLDKWDEASLTMSPISDLFTPDQKHAQVEDSESSDASYCSSAPLGTGGSCSLDCSHEGAPWRGQDASAQLMEARLSALESTMQLRCSALEAKVSLLTSAAARDAEAANKRMHLLQEAVDDAVLKLHKSSDVSVAQTADLSECLRQSSITQARLKTDIDTIWLQLNTRFEALTAISLRTAQDCAPFSPRGTAQDSAPSSPRGEQQEQQRMPPQEGPQRLADESQAGTFSPTAPQSQECTHTAQESAPSSPNREQQQQQQLEPAQKGPQSSADESQAGGFLPMTPRPGLEWPQTPQLPSSIRTFQADAARAVAVATATAVPSTVTAVPSTVFSPEAQDSPFARVVPACRQQSVAYEPRKSLQSFAPQAPQINHRRTVTPLRPVVRSASSPMSSPVLALRQATSPQAFRQQQHSMSGPPALCTSPGTSALLSPQLFHR